MERVIYEKNPLIEVIIQYKFPKILALNSEDPIKFQGEIQAEYPNYQLTLDNPQEISFAIGKNNVPIPSMIQNQPSKNHNFITEDGEYKINLTSSFISISTIHYTKWEDLLLHFKLPLSVFERIYAPSFYQRIGLRYIDSFSKEKLNLKESSWRDLINQPWVGTFSSFEESKVINTGLDVEYILDDNISRAKVHSGIGFLNNNYEKVFIIDSDFIHINNTTKENAPKILSYLHSNAKQFIRSAITDTLHNAMEPRSIL